MTWTTGIGAIVATADDNRGNAYAIRQTNYPTPGPVASYVLTINGRRFATAETNYRTHGGVDGVTSLRALADRIAAA